MAAEIASSEAIGVKSDSLGGWFVSINLRVAGLLMLVVTLALAAIAGEPLTHGRVVQVVVHSRALEHNHAGDSPDRDVSIYLPPDYDRATIRYPVLYLLHGYTGTDRGWMNPAYVGIAELMGHLLDKHAVEPMIIVMPNCFNRFGGSFYTNSALSGDWEDFIVRDLVGYVDAHYRTIAKAHSRGIAGHSMGGYGALRLGMEHPEVFTAAYGMSPCCSYWDEQEDRADVMKASRAKSLDEIVKAGMGPQSELALAAAFSPNLHNPPLGVDWPFDANGQPQPAVIAKWKANLLDAIAVRYANGTERLQVLGFDVGRQDQDEDILTGARRLDQEMTKLGIEHQFMEYNGTHSSGIAQQMQKVVLPLVSKNVCSVEGRGRRQRGSPLMRVIAGQYRSRPLKSMPGFDLRPTSDRLRETLFDVLSALRDTADTVWLDLFAGTGAVGIEALSRGARQVYFVESAKKHARLLRENLAALGITEGYEVQEREVAKALQLLDSTGVVCDYCFLDPPYQRRGAYEQTLGYLAQSRLLQPNSVVIAEHEKKFDPGERFGALLRYRRLDQGDASISFYRLS